MGFSRKSVLIAALYAIWVIPVQSAMPLSVHYASPMGDENWHMTGNRIRCGLSLTIPNFGIAYFEQFAAKPVRFLLTKWEQVVKPSPLRVFAAPPVWKPHGPVFAISKTSLSPGEYAVYLPREETIKSLTYLAQGFQIDMQYYSEEGFDVLVSLSPIRFQEPYSNFQKCVGNLLSFDYNQVALTVFLFNPDSSELNDAAKEQLNRIAEYYRADHSVKKIRIEGYTDDKGRKSYNNAVSEDRAKAASLYLMSRGIQEDEMYITWFGVKNPAAPNDTEEGRAANRRVVIKLIR